MIFYFSGTGNSYYVAKKLSERLNCDMVDMATDRKQLHEFHLKNGEPLGFVFPVYFYTLNNVVYDYIRQLTVCGNGYTFAVITCGGSIGGAGKLLYKELEKRSIHLSRVFPLKMTDNAVFYFNIDDKTKKDIITTESEEDIQRIFEKIEAKETESFSSFGEMRFMRGIYRMMSSTKKFYVTDECIKCGKCVKNCPDKAIAFKDGAPIWIKPNCVKCSACINRCPARAIQYGKGTVKRKRYEHPIFSDVPQDAH